MLFRSTDLLTDFERLTKGLNFGPDFDQAVEDISSKFSEAFAGAANLDVVRSADRLELYLDLPGVDPETVDLTIDGRKLTVTADRTFSVREDQEHVHAGRRHGAFSRSFKLAEDLDVDQLSARSEHGVLIVTVPVTETEQPRKITISS